MIDFSVFWLVSRAARATRPTVPQHDPGHVVHGVQQQWAQEAGRHPHHPHRCVERERLHAHHHAGGNTRESFPFYVGWTAVYSTVYG